MTEKLDAEGKVDRAFALLVFARLRFSEVFGPDGIEDERDERSHTFLYRNGIVSTSGSSRSDPPA